MNQRQSTHQNKNEGWSFSEHNSTYNRGTTLTTMDHRRSQLSKEVLNHINSDNCNLTVEQSFRSSPKKNQPNIMNENLKVLKQSHSPSKFAQTQPHPYKENQPMLKMTQPPQSIKQSILSEQSSICREVESSNRTQSNNNNFLIIDQLNFQNTSRQQDQSIQKDFSHLKRYVHESILEELHNESLQDFEKELLEQLTQGERENYGGELRKCKGQIIHTNKEEKQSSNKKIDEKRFSIALKKYVKQEIHNAFLSTQKVKNNKKFISDDEESRDSLLQLIEIQGEKDQHSYYDDLFKEQNSIEEAVIKEISHNLANKMDGLKSIFNNLESKLHFLEQKQKGVGFQYKQINNVQFFTTSTDNHQQEQLAEQDSELLSQNQVNAQDLDFWVKKADEYKELYMQAEQRNQQLQEEHEQKIQEMQNSFEQRFQEVRLANSLELYSSKQSLHIQNKGVTKCKNCEKFITLSKIVNSNEDMEDLKSMPGNLKCLEKIIEALQKKNVEIYRLNKFNQELDNKVQDAYERLEYEHQKIDTKLKDKEIETLKQEVDLMNEEKETLQLEIRHLNLMLKKAQQQQQ